MSIDHEKEIVNDAFGLWISGLFSAVCSRNVNVSFADKRGKFFIILEKLLMDGKVMFISPGADCYVSPANPTPKLTIDDPEAIWKAPVSEIMDYVKNRWPENANDEKDIELTYYFYELPGLIWIAEDGRRFAS